MGLDQYGLAVPIMDFKSMAEEDFHNTPHAYCWRKHYPLREYFRDWLYFNNNNPTVLTQVHTTVFKPSTHFLQRLMNYIENYQKDWPLEMKRQDLSFCEWGIYMMENEWSVFYVESA